MLYLLTNEYFIDNPYTSGRQSTFETALMNRGSNLKGDKWGPCQ